MSAGHDEKGVVTYEQENPPLEFEYKVEWSQKLNLVRNEIEAKLKEWYGVKDLNQDDAYEDTRIIRLFYGKTAMDFVFHVPDPDVKKPLDNEEIKKNGATIKALFGRAKREVSENMRDAVPHQTKCSLFLMSSL